MSADAGFPDHFSRAARSYATFRPRYPDAIVDWLATCAPRCDLAWDVGCGSGQLSDVLVTRFARVIATDASAEQIARAKAHPRIEYRVARAEDPGLDAASVDLVVAAQSAHWFAQDAFHDVVRRVVRGAAPIVLLAYGRVVVDEPVRAIVDRFYDGPLRDHWPPERRHVESAYRSLPFPFVEFAAPHLELRESWDLERVLGYVETWSATLALRARDPSAVDAWRAEMTAAWGDPSRPRVVTWPLAIRAGRVERRLDP